MIKSILLEEMEAIHTDKKLVQIYRDGSDEFEVAYILASTKDFVTLAFVHPSATLLSVAIIRSSDIDSITVDTLYISELSKMIKGDSLYQKAKKDVESIKNFTFEGFISAFEGTKTLIEVGTENGLNPAVRIVGHDKNVLVADEYSSEFDKRIGRSYIKMDSVTHFAIDVPWLRTVAHALSEKNI